MFFGMFLYGHTIAIRGPVASMTGQMNMWIYNKRIYLTEDEKEEKKKKEEEEEEEEEEDIHM